MLELSIVLTIIALITGMSLLAGQGVLESVRRSSTEEKMNVIEKALMDFRVLHNRLPCPTRYGSTPAESLYGMEYTNAAVNGGTGSPTCEIRSGPPEFFDNVVEGYVPVKALGLPDEYMLDGWGRYIRYAVDMNAAVPDAFLTIRPSESCGIGILDFARDTDGTYHQRTHSRTTDRGMAIRTVITDGSILDPFTLRGNTPVASRDAQGAIYALISHGENGHGANPYNSYTPVNSGGNASVGEQLNCHCTGTADAANYTGFYVQAETYTTSDASKNFDDIVRFKMRYQMQTERDLDNFGTYDGPEVATVDTNNVLTLYTNECGYLRRSRISATGSVVDPTGRSADKVVFSPKNDLFVYDHGSCNEYTYGVVPSQFPTALTDGVNYEARYLNEITGSTLCGAAYDSTASFFLAAKAGIMVVLKSSSDYTELWQYSPITHRYTYGRTDAAPFLSPQLQYDLGAVTPDGRYLYVRRPGAGQQGIIYKLKPDANGLRYNRLETQPSWGPGDHLAAAFSPNGKYLVVTTNTPSLEVYYINQESDTLTMLAGTPNLGLLTKDIEGVRFSPDGNYLALMNDDISSDLYDQVNVFRVLYSPVTTELTFNDMMGGTSTHIAFSPGRNGSVIQTYADIGETENSPTFPVFTSDSRYLLGAVDGGIGGGVWPMFAMKLAGLSGDYSTQLMYVHEGNIYYGVDASGTVVTGLPVKFIAPSN